MQTSLTSVQTLKYLNEMKKIQETLLEFIDEESSEDENSQDPDIIFESLKSFKDKHKLKSFLHLIVGISNNHHRGPSFFIKIEQILNHLKTDIIKNFPNWEIFNIFKSNKRLLLLLLDNKMIQFDEYVAKNVIKEKFVKANYPLYFQPEISPYINEKWFPKKEDIIPMNQQSNKNQQEKEEVVCWIDQIKKELPENFSEKRKKGENDSYICKLIQEDLVEEFISYINRSNIPHNSIIKPSIFETNQFLIDKEEEFKNRRRSYHYFSARRNQKPEILGITLIEYAAFFGSLQIIRYLKAEGVEFTSSIWPYALHSENAELIHFLEENKVETNEKTYKPCIMESIKCHHNNFANYFLSNFLQKEIDNSQDSFILSLKHYNFAFIQNFFINESSLFFLCKYDYYTLVDILYQVKFIDINKTIVSVLFNIISNNV